MSKDTDAKLAGTAAGVGTATIIGATVSGASAATMTSILAGAGSLVGGGMAAGIFVTAAAPVAVGAAIYGLVKIFSED